MNGFMFSNIMREVHQIKAVERVLEALIREPFTARGLAKELRMSVVIVRVCIGILRKAGYGIENRDWCAVPGHNRKGTYHLGPLPAGGTGPF